MRSASAKRPNRVGSPLKLKVPSWESISRLSNSALDITLVLARLVFMPVNFTETIEPND